MRQMEEEWCWCCTQKKTKMLIGKWTTNEKTRARADSWQGAMLMMRLHPSSAPFCRKGKVLYEFQKTNNHGQMTPIFFFGEEFGFAKSLENRVW